jgi:hypothetical protein
MKMQTFIKFQFTFYNVVSQIQISRKSTTGGDFKSHIKSTSTPPLGRPNQAWSEELEPFEEAEEEKEQDKELRSLTS